MTRARITLGKEGEAVAAAFLERHGCRIIDRNFRTRLGEIDLIAKDGDEVVFVEVKTRRGDRFGPPEEAVTFAKRRHLRMAAEAYLAARDVAALCRIDVVAVTLRAGSAPEIRWIRDAVGG
jgi:putative endonuclease